MIFSKAISENNGTCEINSRVISIKITELV